MIKRLNLAAVTRPKKSSYFFLKKSFFFHIGYAFSKKLGLDSKITSWDQTNRIPRRKLPVPRSKLENLGQNTSNLFFYSHCCEFRFVKYTCLMFSRRPGGFRDLWEACRNHFHLSWYFSDSVVPSYGQKPWWFCFSIYGMANTVHGRFFTIF